MLILSRLPGEAITIGGDIRITVISNNEAEVKLGIEAPAYVKILREELRPHEFNSKVSKPEVKVRSSQNKVGPLGRSDRRDDDDFGAGVFGLDD